MEQMLWRAKCYFNRLGGYLAANVPTSSMATSSHVNHVAWHHTCALVQQLSKLIPGKVQNLVGFFGKRIVLQIYFVLITCIFLLRFIFAFPKIEALIFLQIFKGSQTRPKAFPQCKLQQSSSSESSTKHFSCFWPWIR